MKRLSILTAVVLFALPLMADCVSCCQTQPAQDSTWGAIHMAGSFLAMMAGLMLMF